MPSAVRLELPVVPIAQQCVVVRIRFHVNASAVASVASGGPASRDVLLPPERHAAGSAVCALHQNFRFVDKHALSLPSNPNASFLAAKTPGTSGIDPPLGTRHSAPLPPCRCLLRFRLLPRAHALRQDKCAIRTGCAPASFCRNTQRASAARAWCPTHLSG